MLLEKFQQNYYGFKPKFMNAHIFLRANINLTAVTIS